MGLGLGPDVWSQADTSLGLGCYTIVQMEWNKLDALQAWTLDCWCPLGAPGMCCVFRILSKLRILWVSNSRGWNTFWSHNICWQDQAVYIWNSEGLSCHCTLCSTSSWASQQWWHWWWCCCWLASNSEYSHLIYYLQSSTQWIHIHNQYTTRLMKEHLKREEGNSLTSGELSGRKHFTNSAYR